MEGAGLIGIVVVCLVILVVMAVVEARNKHAREEERKAYINSMIPRWGQEMAQLVYNRRIAIGMNPEMVVTSWGKPNSIDEQEITAKSKKERWVYGIPRKKGVRYVWFKDEAVSKMKV